MRFIQCNLSFMKICGADIRGKVNSEYFFFFLLPWSNIFIKNITYISFTEISLSLKWSSLTKEIFQKENPMTFRQCKIKHIIRYSLVCAREIYLIVRCPVRKFVGEKYLLNGTTCTIFKKKKKNKRNKTGTQYKKSKTFI